MHPPPVMDKLRQRYVFSVLKRESNVILADSMLIAFSPVPPN